MKLKRMILLAVSVALLLALSATVTTSLAYSYLGPMPEDIINSGTCPSRDAQLRNNGLHCWRLGDWTEPSCTGAGIAYYNCVYCDGFMNRQFAAALGHIWSDWQEVPGNLPASCVNPRIEFRTCSRCGEYERRQTTIGHQWGDWWVETPGTCTQQQMNGRRCSVCRQEEYVYAGYGDHVPDVLVGVPPTCEEAGLSEGSKCTVCGKILTEQEPIPALGHLWDSGVVNREPGYMTEGQLLFTCQNDPEHTRVEPIPALMEGASTEELFDKLRIPKNPPAKPQSDPLRIVTQPVGGNVSHDGSDVLPLTVEVAGGTPPYSYQWEYKDIFSLFSWKASTSPTITTAVAAGLGGRLDSAASASSLLLTQQVSGFVERIGDILGRNAGTGFVTRNGGVSTRKPINPPRPATPVKIGWHDVEGATESTLNVTEGGRYYDCVITDAAGKSITSDEVKVGWKLYITSQPEGGVFFGKNDVEMSCSASGGEPDDNGYAIAWYKRISQFTSELQKSSVTKEDNTFTPQGAGSYFCIITDSLGETVTSNVVTVREATKLSVTNIKSSSQRASASNTVTASIVGGEPPFKVIWEVDAWNYGLIDYEEKENVESRSLSRTAKDGGYYFAKVEDSLGQYADAEIYVKGPTLDIVRQPADYQLRPNQTASLTVQVRGGTPPYYYDLLLDGEEVDLIYNTNNAIATFEVDELGTYTIQIHDSIGREALSAKAKVTSSTYKELEIASYTDVVYIPSASGSATLSVTAKGGTPPYTYQWANWVSEYPQHSTLHLNYGTYVNNIYKTSSITVHGYELHTKYICTVTDAKGDSVTSKPMYVYYTGAPYITLQPKNDTVKYSNSTAVLTCRAYPANTYDQRVLKYQWQQKTEGGWHNYGPPQTGETTVNFASRLLLSGGELGKYYRCVVTDTKTGKQSTSYSALASVAMDIWDYHQVGKSGAVEMKFSGGVPPFKISAQGYYVEQDSVSGIMGIPMTTLEGGYKVYAKPAYPSSVITDQNGDTTVVIKDLARFDESATYFTMIVIIPVWTYSKTPYYWQVTVTDATGAVVRSNWLEMDW